MASTPAAKAAANCLRSGSAWPSSDLPIAMKKLEISGPEAPPMVPSSFRPIFCRATAGGMSCRSGLSVTSTSQPRRTLMK